MSFYSEKTCQHLRQQILEQGRKERMYALHCLSHGYGQGSEAALATMLLASLGGSHAESAPEHELVADKVPTKVVTEQVAKPMQQSANDSGFAAREVVSGV